MAEQLRTRHLCITLNPGQRTLNLSEGDTTNVHKARSDSSDPPIPRSPDPPPSGVLNGKTPQAAGFCFVDKLRRLTGPLAGLAQVQESRGSCGEAGGRGGVAVKRPMMIDAIAKRKAAAKVKAINFSIRLPPGPEATLSA